MCQQLLQCMRGWPGHVAAVPGVREQKNPKEGTCFCCVRNVHVSLSEGCSLLSNPIVSCQEQQHCFLGTAQITQNGFSLRSCAPAGH